MLHLEDKFDCIPLEQKPIGAKLEQPDLNIRIELDTTELKIKQEGSTGEDAFAAFCTEVSAYVLDSLYPATPHYSGVMASTYFPFSGAHDLHRATLGVDAIMHERMAALLRVSPQSQVFTHQFTSGSQELQVTTQEVVLSTNATKLHNPGFRPTERERRNALRRNEATERVAEAVNTFGLLLDVDLRETNPEVAQLPKQYDLLKSYVARLQTEYFPEFK